MDRFADECRCLGMGLDELEIGGGDVQGHGSAASNDVGLNGEGNGRGARVATPSDAEQDEKSGTKSHVRPLSDAEWSDEGDDAE